MLGSVDDHNMAEHSDWLSVGRLNTQTYEYLVAAPSLYTQDQLKKCKSLDAYHAFVDG